jgi:hypothetical protein
LNRRWQQRGRVGRWWLREEQAAAQGGFTVCGGAGQLHGVHGAGRQQRLRLLRCDVCFFLEHERCYLLCVSSNPNGLAWADWPSPLGLLYTTTHSLPHQRSQSRSHRGASPLPSAMKQPCCAARPEAVLCRSTLLL